MTRQERVEHLQAATAEGLVLEHTMLDEPIFDADKNETATPHSSTTFLVVFESRRQAIFKPFEMQNRTACGIYGHHPHDAILNEVVAWRLAHAMGPPWRELVPAAVLRDVPDVGPGVLINWQPGKGSWDVFRDAEAQAKHAGFWDGLIGQQDRHVNNFRYDHAGRRLALIDNAFAFARPGDFSQSSLFLRRRKSQFGPTLTQAEKAALEALHDSGDLHGLRRYLDEDRSTALDDRVVQMLRCGCLPGVGGF